MDQLDIIKENIQSLPIVYKAENVWEGTKYKPYTLKLIELDKVLRILDLIKDLNLK